MITIVSRARGTELAGYGLGQKLVSFATFWMDPDRSERLDCGNSFRNRKYEHSRSYDGRTGVIATQNCRRRADCRGMDLLARKSHGLSPRSGVSDPLPIWGTFLFLFLTRRNEFRSPSVRHRYQSCVGYVMPKGRCSVLPDDRWRRRLNGCPIHNWPRSLKW